MASKNLDHIVLRPVALPIIIQLMDTEKKKRPTTNREIAMIVGISLLTVAYMHAKNTNMDKCHRLFSFNSLRSVGQNFNSTKAHPAIAPKMYGIILTKGLM